MKIISIFVALLCLSNISYAQHLIQIDDGFGSTLLLAPPAGLSSGVHILTFPTPPTVPMPAGFISAGSVSGQLAIWDNALMAWMPVNSNAALNALLPSQGGNAGRVLFTDGTNTGWTAISAGGAISVFGRTGIVTPQTGDYNFTQIAGSASPTQLPNLQNMNGVLDIAQGGTGQSTPNSALNAFLPGQSGNANKVLQTDGINTNWVLQASAPVASVFGRIGAVVATTGDYNFSQISGSATASQLPNLQNLNGILDIAHGGTGQITANASLNALLPTQTSNATKFLQTDGTNTSWVAIPGSPITSVFGRTGIIISATNDYSFSQISGSAVASQLPNLQNLNGILDIAHGGTGQITANASLNALLPTQTSNATKFLQTDGSNTSWVAIPASPITSVFGRTGIIISASNDYSFSQISGSATASQLPNLQNMNGLLDIAHGGTGQITSNASLNGLLPTQTGNGTKFLQTDGSNTSWVAIPASPITSVFGRTGVIISASNDYSFSQISGSAIASQLPSLENLNGLLDIGHGGTGQITANASLNALLPSQTSSAAKFLQTDGSNTSWVGIPASSITSVFGRTGIIVSASNDYSFSQISGAATASQLPNLQNMNGLLDIAHGGTGQITANASLNALLPTQTSSATKFLQTDGSNTNWVGIPASPITSVFGRTGIIISASNDYSFAQISGSAVASQLPNLQNLNGILDIAHGGTGQITANASLNALLPAQTSSATKFLQTDGSNTSWVAIPASSITSVFGRTGIIVSASNDYSFAQISGSATASQLPNLENLNGLLDIAHGGTGQSSGDAALNALLPSQSGNANRVLQSNGSSTQWIDILSAPVTSVFGRTGIITSATNDYNFSQISGSAVASQLPNLENLNGLLDIAHGGTGQNTANDALNALLPSQSGNANSILQTDGTNATWVTISAGGVTSVFGRTGSITAQNNDYSFAQISGSATASQLPNLENLNGLLDIAHGGTGQSTANDALNALLPSQSGNANSILQTDGTNASWVSIPSSPITSVFGRTGVVVAAANDYGFSQISGSATASQLPNLENLNGILDAAHGGIGANTSSAANGSILYMSAGVWTVLAPDANTKVLTLSGGLPSWASPTTGTVTSLDGTGTNGITISGGPVTSSGTLSVGISTNGIALDRIAQISLNTLLGNISGSPGNITALSTSQVKTMLSLNNVENTALSTWAGSANITTLGTITSGTWNGTLIAPTKGGTGLTTYTLGDLLYGSGSNTLAVLGGNISSTKKFLTQTGNGTISAIPSWATIAASDIPVMVASGASHAAGAVPDPGSSAGTTKFLREDGTWQVPSGGSGGGMNYDVTTSQATITTSTDYLFNVAYSGSAAAANAAGAIINSVASGANNSGTALTITADGGSTSLNKGIVITGGNTSGTNISSTGIVVTANATGTGTSKGLDITCVGGTNRVGLVLTDGHLQSKQTTTVTAAKQAGAGSTATVTTTGCTDIAGKLLLTTKGTGRVVGAQVKVTFNKPFATAPIVVVTPGAFVTFVNGPYISSVTTTDFTIAFATAPGGDGEDQIFYYHVIETQ